MKQIILSLVSAASFVCFADDGYGPNGAQHAPSAYRAPADVVPGGAFIDRILPIPFPNGLRSDTWGGPNVKPRVVENSLEDPAWSYWCMSNHIVNGWHGCTAFYLRSPDAASSISSQLPATSDSARRQP